MNENNECIKLSPLGKTWILDIDGTIVLHNGYKINGVDSFLPGAKEFLLSIPKEDMIVFITSRTDEYAELTESFFRKNDIKFDKIIYNAPYGERILINDRKQSGLNTSVAVNTERDVFCKASFCIDKSL